MTEALLVAGVVLCLAILAILFILLKRNPEQLFSALQLRLDSLEKSQERIERSVRDDNAKNREEAASNARQTREEMTNAIVSFGNSLQKQMTGMADLQNNQFSSFTKQLSLSTQTNEQKLHQMRETIEQRLEAIQKENTQQLSLVREDLTASGNALREEVNNAIVTFGDSLQRQITGMAELQSH
ncbi:MAG: hypothetical protein LAO21_20945 [Acidobacteriia bacterium]|nr:hypothetical protein [Terriglobia bacterium]